MLHLSSLPVSISKLKPDPHSPASHGTALQVATVVLHVSDLRVRSWPCPSQSYSKWKSHLGCSWDHLVAALSPPGKVLLCVHLARFHNYCPVISARTRCFHRGTKLGFGERTVHRQPLSKWVLSRDIWKVHFLWLQCPWDSEVQILREEKQTERQITALDTWRADFGLLGRIQWIIASERGIEESWNFYRYYLIESWNHKLIWVGRDPQMSSCPTLLQWRGIHL